MTRLIKTQTEWEGVSHDRYSIVEGETPPIWPVDNGLTVIGKGLPRIDGIERVTGRAVYTWDVQLPGMLYARILRSPFPHARIKKLDTSRAEALPGVRAVLTHLNAPLISWWNSTYILEPVLRYVGDEVAVIAADNAEVANDALDLIDVEYETLPFVLTAEEGLSPGAPQIYPSGNLVRGKARSYNRGDIRQGFRTADIVLEETFRTQSALHNCLESHGSVASWDGDELTVWESTQAINRVRDELAETFKLPLHKVHVICQYMGSGFGSKQYTGKWSVLAALLARLTARPVHLMLDRREENLATGNRSPTVQHIKIGAKRDGTLTSIDLDVSITLGAYGYAVLSVEGPAQVLYSCPNVHSEVRSVFTNTGPARSFRGPGYVEGTFPLESMIDELAAQLELDPLAIRRKNYASVEQTSGQPYSAKNLDKCYLKGAEIIGWESFKPVSQSAGVRRRAAGMASQTWGGGGGPPAYAWMRMNGDGSIEVITSSQDIGTGTRTVFAQIAAEELGIDPSKIAVRIGDTSQGPYDPVSWGSMTVSSVGPAIRQAALDLRNQLHQISAGFLNVPESDLMIKGEAVYVHGESQPRISLSDLAGEIGDITLLGKGSREPNQTAAAVRTFGAQFADVEVNTLTGEINVLNIVTVHDFGRVINPLGARSQAEGAVIQGIGYALTEGRMIDLKSGIILNTNLEDYMVPSALDFNKIGYAFIDEPDNLANNLGAKGLGEPALIPSAPAIANAIARATGLRFLSLPITRQKILEGIQKYDGGRGVVL